MDEMQKEVLARIDALAEKLGTTAEYLWGALVADVARRGVVGAVIYGVIALALLASGAWLMRASLRLPFKQDPELTYVTSDGNSERRIVGTTCGALVVVMALFYAHGAATHALTAASPHIEAWSILTGAK